MKEVQVRVQTPLSAQCSTYHWIKIISFVSIIQQNLDLVLLYLRVVHCIDFYNANEYHYEDEMPMRCGIMHVRAQPLVSGNKKDGKLVCFHLEKYSAC